MFCPWYESVLEVRVSISACKCVYVSAHVQVDTREIRMFFVLNKIDRMSVCLLPNYKLGVVSIVMCHV